MVVVLLLGPGDEFLGHKTFKQLSGAEEFIDSIHPLIIANIERELSLKERLRLAPSYFAFAGRIENIELINLEEERGE